MEYAVCVLAGYFLGCFNTAHLLARLRGVDIRSQGSRNPGASNVTVTMGWRFGVVVALVDIFKAVTAVSLCRWWFPGDPLVMAVAGACCILGHIFPFYLGFRGGKGFASYIGMALAMNLKIALVLILAAALITILTNYIALATLFTAAVFPLWAWFSYQDLAIAALLAALGAVIFWKHRENLRRIRAGEEIGLRKAPLGPRQ